MYITTREINGYIEDYGVRDGKIIYINEFFPTTAEYAEDRDIPVVPTDIDDPDHIMAAFERIWQADKRAVCEWRVPKEIYSLEAYKAELQVFKGNILKRFPDVQIEFKSDERLYNNYVETSGMYWIENVVNVMSGNSCLKVTQVDGFRSPETIQKVKILFGDFYRLITYVIPNLDHSVLNTKYLYDAYIANVNTNDKPVGYFYGGNLDEIHDWLNDELRRTPAEDIKAMFDNGLNIDGCTDPELRRYISDLIGRGWSFGPIKSVLAYHPCFIESTIKSIRKSIGIGDDLRNVPLLLDLESKTSARPKEYIDIV